MNKFVKFLLVIAIIIVALLFVVMALSPVAKSVVNNHGQEIIGRDMQVERVFVNPFFGTVDIRDFHCKEANGETDFVSFSRLYVQMNWLSLMGKHVNLRHIHLIDLNGEVLSSDQGFNFTDIIERFAKDSTDTDTLPSAWTVRLSDIRLVNGNLAYRDVIRDKRWKMNNVNLTIPGLYFGNQQTNAGLEFDLPSGGRVGITAGYVMARRRYAVTLTMQDVNTDVALPLVQDYLSLSGISSLVNARIHVDGCLDNLRDLYVTGSLSMDNLSLLDDRDDEIAGIANLYLTLDRINLLYNRFAIDTLKVTGITGSYEKTNDYTTLSRLLRKTETDSTQAEEVVETPSTKSMPVQWSVRHLLMEGQNLTYTDRSIRPRFSYAVQSFTLKGTNVSPMADNSLSLTANLTHGARLTASVNGPLNLTEGHTTLNAKLTRVQVVDFSPFTESLMAYPIEDGLLALESTNTLQNGMLDGNTHITIDQMKVGNRQRLSKAKYKNVPLKLGVKLLKSAQGLIVLDLPVKGDARSPKFDYRKIIGRALAKVFFGPLMGVKDNRKLISEDEVEEMMEILAEDSVTVEPVATVAMETTPETAED